MFVRCHQCATDYEFDDTLISERGTLVRCTQCSAQFKIYPPDGGAGPERWVVRTQGGRELVYTSLRELQRGIAAGQIGPEDIFSRGRFPARTLGSLAELRAFFPSQGVLAEKPAEPDAVRGEGSAEPAEPIVLSSDASPPRAAGPEINVAPMVVRSVGGLSSATPPPPPSRQKLSLPAAAEAAEEETLSEPSVTSGVAGYQEPFPVYDAIMAQSAAHADDRPQARSRWIAGVVFLALAGLVASTVGRRYLVSLSGREMGSANTDHSPRITEFLASAHKRIDEGDYESAKEQLDKASALVERNSTILSALARLETLRADMVWLKLRLIDPQANELVQSTQHEFTLRLSKAQQAVAVAFSMAPEDPAVMRAHVDVLRMAGETVKAREWVVPISANAGQPENAYVLAVLDLAEPEPPVWSSVIERLRLAASAELESGRAHAALVLALVQAQLITDAQAELSKLQGKTHHALLPYLSEFVRRSTVEHVGPLDGRTPRPRENIDKKWAPELKRQGSSK